MKRLLSLLSLFSCACNMHSLGTTKFSVEDCIAPRDVEFWDSRYTIKVVTEIGKYSYRVKSYDDGKWFYTYTAKDAISFYDESKWVLVDCPTYM